LSDSRSSAHSIFVSGSDIYLAGYEEVGENWIATYWKNGQAVRLSNRESMAESILVVGSDVYVAGMEDVGKSNFRATYWKNGQAVRLGRGRE
jgi:hypothetical protein